MKLMLKIYDVCKHLQANVDGGQCGVMELIPLSLSTGTSKVKVADYWNAKHVQ